MKHNMTLNGNKVTVNAQFGTKIGHSPYFLCWHDSPTNKEDIIKFFMASTLETAIREAVLSDYFKENKTVNLITGDGQVIRITLD